MAEFAMSEASVENLVGAPRDIILYWNGLCDCFCPACQECLCVCELPALKHHTVRQVAVGAAVAPSHL